LEPTKGQAVRVEFVFFSWKRFASASLNVAGGVISIAATPKLFLLHGSRLVQALKKDMTFELNEGEATIMYVLYSSVGFERPISEEDLYDRLVRFHKESKLRDVAKGDFYAVNSRLAKLGLISIEDGNVKLIEDVVIK
jgi:hypothetical protein